MSVFFVERTPVVDGWLARRRELGLDGKDEVWEGVYHVAPGEHARNVTVMMALGHLTYDKARAAGLTPCGPFNLGVPDDYRIPDAGYYRGAPTLYLTDVPIVVEVLSPNDETFAKFGFYAAHGVEELWVVDPLERSVRVWQLGAEVDGAEYAETGRSDLLDLTAEAVELELDWPNG